MIYLDSAATTLQKPAAVVRASAYAMTHMSSPGRGGHPPAMLAAETAFACRTAAAKLFHVKDSEHVVLTFNATHGLNIAIKSLVQPGSTVLISGYEHNAVTRPLAGIEGITVRVAASPVFCPEMILESFDRQLTSEVACVVCNHVSNVFGYVLPVKEIADLCHQRGVHFILDASQSAGCFTVDMSALGADYIAMPGHKGLYGPQGTGLLLCGNDTPCPLLEGGTGSASLLQEMPEFLPDRLEAGTHNITGVAGLLEGLRFVMRRGCETILRHEQHLCRKAAAGLLHMDGVKVYADPDAGRQGGVLSFVAHGMDCEEIGEKLGSMGIAVRAGLHCAPLAHRSAGTEETGTVRVSFSIFNTEQEVDRFLLAVRSILFPVHH